MDALTIGRKLARKVFETRGNHSETHLSEVELAALLAYAVQLHHHQGTLPATPTPRTLRCWFCNGELRGHVCPACSEPEDDRRGAAHLHEAEDDDPEPPCTCVECIGLKRI